MATQSIICLPGILSRSNEQHKPLYLERLDADVFYVDPPSANDMSFNDYISMVAQMIESEHQNGQPVVLIGSSFGGDIAAFVHEQLQSRHVDIDDWLTLVVVDAPAGLRSFVAMPGFVSPKLALSPIGSALLLAIGTATTVANSMGIGVPKDEYITRPHADVMQYMAGRTDFSDEEWNDWVKQTAKKNLKGHKGSLYRDQIQWMTRVFEDGTLDRAVRSLKGHKVVYIQCTKGNDVVAQPMAQRWWLDRIGTTDTYRTVEAPHCGYLQMQPEFDLKIAPLAR